MNFKAPHLEVEFDHLHPELRALLLELDQWSGEHKFAAVLVAHALRTLDDQERIYLPIYQENTGLPPERARALARQRFSWHLVGCAVDIRNSHYSEDERRTVVSWLRGRVEPVAGDWELLEHDIGRGEHIHIARRDVAWRKAHSPHGGST